VLRQQPVDLGNPEPLRRIGLQPLETTLAPQFATFGFEVLAVEISHGALWALAPMKESAITACAVVEDLRLGMDRVGGDPPPFGKADRSWFLQALDRVMVGIG
jgi:hypothetical protein